MFNLPLSYDGDFGFKVSPGLLAKCGLVVMEESDFTWKAIFSNWFHNSVEDESIMRYYPIGLAYSKSSFSFVAVSLQGIQ